MKVNDKIRFKRGNEVRYLCDFSMHQGVPTNITFTIKHVSSFGVKIVAKGYGLLNQKRSKLAKFFNIDVYGNGALYINKDELWKREKQFKRVLL